MTPNFRLNLSKASFIKKGFYACQSLDNVEMYKYTKFYQDIPCGSRVISVFANCSLTGFGRTHTPIIVQTCGLCNYFDKMNLSLMRYENIFACLHTSRLLFEEGVLAVILPINIAWSFMVVLEADLTSNRNFSFRAEITVKYTHGNPNFSFLHTSVYRLKSFYPMSRL